MSWIGIHPELPKNKVPNLCMCKRCRYLYRVPRIHKNFNIKDNCIRCNISMELVLWNYKNA